MENKLEKFKNYFAFKDDSQLNEILNIVKELGLDKCFEILRNFKDIKGIHENINPIEFYEFTLYEFSLSTFLFCLLRREENTVKGFLCNIRGGSSIFIEERPSNFTRTKYYFKFPNRNGEYLYIRTHIYKGGKVKYYDAIKTLDFGDINLLFSHLSSKEIELFSKNKNILNDLDKSRRLRNYVYHHNILFSLGKEELKNEILIVIRNLPDEETKKFFIDRLNNIKNKHDYINLSDDLIIKINEDDNKLIFSI